MSTLALAISTHLSPAENQSREDSIDALFAEFNGAATPGAAVMIIHEGKAVLTRTYGMADREKKIPVSAATNFRLASVSKQFTAMSVLMLAEKGKLSLDDSIVKFFPEFPDYGKAITVRHLLNHTSGMPDYEDLVPEGTTLQVTDRDVLLLVMKQPSGMFAPGAKYHYSNSAYALLSLIVEVVSGETFPAYLKRHIFSPLQMAHTLAYVPGVSSVPNRAFGFAKNKDGVAPSDQSLTSAVLGDGGIYSSLNDLFHWDQALYTDKLVSRATLAKAFSSTVATDKPETGYGYGWYVGNHRGLDHVWHSGSTCGFTTRLERFPQRQFTVIILTNRRNAPLDGLAKKIADLYLF